MGDALPVRFAETGVQQLTIGAVYEEAATVGEYLIGLDTYDANVADRFDFQVVVTAADGVEPRAGPCGGHRGGRRLPAGRGAGQGRVRRCAWARRPT